MIRSLIGPQLTSTSPYLASALQMASISPVEIGDELSR